MYVGSIGVVIGLRKRLRDFPTVIWICDEDEQNEVIIAYSNSLEETNTLCS